MAPWCQGMKKTQNFLDKFRPVQDGNLERQDVRHEQSINCESSEFNRFYRRWWAPLNRLFVRRFGKSSEDAQDATQEILLRMGQQAVLPAEDEQSAYLQIAARNFVTDEWRCNGRGTRQQDVSLDAMEERDLVQMVDESASPLDEVAGRQLLARLSDAVDELPARQKRAFLLNRIDGLSYDEVARQMAISPRMVAKHIARALAYCELRVQFASLEQMRKAQLAESAAQALLMPEKSNRTDS